MSQADVRPKHSRAGLVVGRLGPMPLNAPVPVAPKGRSEAQDAETAKALAHAVEMDAASARCSKPGLHFGLPGRPGAS